MDKMPVAKKNEKGKKDSLRDRFRTTFASLKHRNYRLWFWGQMVSLFGTWMQATAQGFLIYELTHSPAYLGLVAFIFGIPSWIFTLYSGVILDRVSRKNLLLVTQVSMMILAFVLAGLTFTGVVRPWHILVLSFLLGVANAFEAPARHAIVPEMVPREDIPNAVSLNGIMFNSSTIVGPALGGIIYALVGAGWCFVLNGISFLAIIFGLLLMRLPKFKKNESKASMMEDLREGMAYMRNHPLLFGLIWIMAVTGLFGLSFMTIIPAWSVAVLHGDAKTNGLLQAARGIGALLVVVWVASLGNFRFKGRLVTIGLFGMPILSIIFAFVRNIPGSLLVMAFAGMANVLVANVSTSLVQLHTEEKYRGRVMGIYTFVFFGSMPLGSLWVGAVAGWLGEATAIIICSVATLICSFLIWRFVPSLVNAE